MRYSLLTAGMFAALTLTACGGAEEAAKKATDTTKEVANTAKDATKEAVATATGGDASKYKDIAGVSMEVSGAGASFPNPIYSKWSEDFGNATGGKINYSSIGSSGGIKQITAKTVDFGASDKPMKPEELKKHGLIQFPTVIGGVVPVVNLEGVKEGTLVLDGPTLAAIYLGKITKWNDPAIVALNEGISLPDANITTVHRSDGSGTTFNFTDYLNKVSPDWASVGASKTVEWPTDATGTGVGGKGNEGVAGMVKQAPNSIGYVEFAYAKKMTFVALKNAAGKVVQPSAETFAAAGDVDWSQAEGFHKVLTNASPEDAWPIAAATFILVHTNPENPEQVAGALNFFNWAYDQGDEAALHLDYVPFSDNAVALFKEQWKQVVTAEGKPVYTPQ